MNIEEAKQYIASKVVESLEGIIDIKLEKGECCPFCGRKKGSRIVSEKMLEANRLNIKKAIKNRTKNI